MFVVTNGREIAAVVENEIRSELVLEGLELHLDALVVLGLGLAFPREHGNAGLRDRSGRLVFSRREDVGELLHVTSAPSAVSVSMSTAVCVVM